MDFRAFPVVAIEVTRQAMAEMVENGGKWISAGKWWKMDFRVLSAIPLLLNHGRLIRFRDSLVFFGIC